MGRFGRKHGARNVGSSEGRKRGLNDTNKFIGIMIGVISPITIKFAQQPHDALQWVGLAGSMA
jgi:hypothetical protein